MSIRPPVAHPEAAQQAPDRQDPGDCGTCNPAPGAVSSLRHSDDAYQRCVLPTTNLGRRPSPEPDAHWLGVPVGAVRVETKILP